MDDIPILRSFVRNWMDYIRFNNKRHPELMGMEIYMRVIKRG